MVEVKAPTARGRVEERRLFTPFRTETVKILKKLQYWKMLTIVDFAIAPSSKLWTEFCLATARAVRRMAVRWRGCGYEKYIVKK